MLKSKTGFKWVKQNQWWSKKKRGNYFHFSAFAPFWQLYLKALSLLLLFCQLLDLWKPSQAVNQCGEEHRFPLKSPSPSDDAAQGFTVTEYFAVAALKKQFVFHLFLCKPFAEDPVSSVGGCPHCSNNHQQPTAQRCLYCRFLFWPYLARFHFSDLHTEDIMMLYFFFMFHSQTIFSSLFQI